MQLAGCDFDSDSEFLEATVRVEASMRDHPTVRGHGSGAGREQVREDREPELATGVVREELLGRA